jgi:hypothetical protein
VQVGPRVEAAEREVVSPTVAHRRPPVRLPRKLMFDLTGAG